MSEPEIKVVVDEHGHIEYRVTNEGVLLSKDEKEFIAIHILHLCAENEKLRELCADMWRFTGTACKKYPRLFDPAAQGGQTVQLNMIDAFEQRMRELEIEVSA